MAQRTPQHAAPAIPISPGVSANHPVYITAVTPSPVPGHTAQPDPTVVAAQQTAQYTFDLAIVTGLLFGATILALVVGEVQRRLGVEDAEKARKAQYESDRTLQENELAAVEQQRKDDAQGREQEAQASREASLSQLLAILQSYERGMNILLIAAHYPIASRARTMEALFRRVFTDGIVSAVPENSRSQILGSVIKAQETLQVASENQSMHDSMIEALEREGQTMALFSQRLKTANHDHEQLEEAVRKEGDLKHKALLEEHLRAARRRLEDVKASPEAYVAMQFIKTEPSRKQKLDALYPNITANAVDAKRELVAARALLGDDTVTDFVPEEPTT